jgi:hypothetical protein
MTMVRIVLLVSLLTAAALSPAAAQIGIIGGWSYSTVSASDGGADLETGYHAGFHLGVTYSGDNLLGIMAEALYTRKGFTVGEGSSETAVDLGYFEIPIMLAVTLPVARVYAGGNLGLRLSCSAESDVALGGAGFVCEDEIRDFGFGVKGGAGIRLLLLTIDAAVTYGTSNISRLQGRDMKNRTLYISAGLVLPSL